MDQSGRFDDMMDKDYRQGFMYPLPLMVRPFDC